VLVICLFVGKNSFKYFNANVVHPMLGLEDTTLILRMILLEDLALNEHQKLWVQAKLDAFHFALHLLRFWMEVQIKKCLMKATQKLRV
jgi:hypothetical protein